MVVVRPKTFGFQVFVATSAKKKANNSFFLNLSTTRDQGELSRHRPDKYRGYSVDPNRGADTWTTNGFGEIAGAAFPHPELSLLGRYESFRLVFSC